MMIPVPVMPNVAIGRMSFGLIVVLLGLYRADASEPATSGRLVTVLKGHTEAVYAIAFTPDGKQVLTGSFDKTIKLWDAVTGKEIKTFGGAAGHQDLVLGVAISPDGHRFASVSSDKTAKVWELPHQRPSHKFLGIFEIKNTAKDAVPIKSLGHPQMVDSVAFSPSGKQLATAGHDGLIHIWDVEKWQQVREIKAHTTPAASAIYALAWSPDGKQITSASLDHALKLWDAGAGALLREFKAYKEKEFDKGHRDGVFCMAFSPDGQTIASGSSDRTIKLWNVSDGKVLREFVNPTLGPTMVPGPTATTLPQAQPGWIYSLRFSADGARLISAGNAPRNHGYLAVWNVADGHMIFGGKLALGPIYSIALAPDGKSLAIACGPQGGQYQDVSSYIIRLSETDKRQASRGPTNPTK
jgi:WD40 repeat protein